MDPALTTVVILAAGMGKRFRSATPKVLHPCAGRPLVGHVVEAAGAVPGVGKIVVVAGSHRTEIETALADADPRLAFVTQPEPMGTADAVKAARTELEGQGTMVVVLSGDGPLVSSVTIGSMVAAHVAGSADVTLLTAVLDDPSGYGRILRGEGGEVTGIVEEADADERQRAIAEVSTGIWVFTKDRLFDALDKVEPSNAQGEYYLPDAALVLISEGGRIVTVRSDDPKETMGVNDRLQLAEAAKALRARKIEELALAGVTFIDPETTYVDVGVSIGADTTIYPMTFLEGETSVGSGCTIGPNVRIVDSTVGDEAEITFAVVRGSKIGPRTSVGPFASLRPGTEMAEGSKIGTFVETKATTIGEGSKVPHLSYMGDAEIGAGSNVGAGTITCNYDGETKTKSKTKIGDDVLVGSDTMLVAPVSLEMGAVTAAGSVVTRDVGPEDVVAGVPAKVVRKRKPRPRDNGV